MVTLPITLRPDELPTFRAAVIACTSTAERESCERLLGQIASLEAATSDGRVAFVPPPRSAALAYRAVAVLRAASDHGHADGRAGSALRRQQSDGHPSGA